MKKVYIAHPYLGRRRNKKKVDKIILKLLKENPTILYVSPIHAMGFYYFELSYEDGMEHCFELLSMCDELWLCRGWEKSVGCRLEKEFAERTGVPIRYL